MTRSNDPYQYSEHAPQLGGNGAILSGYEPLLGGVRRTPIDLGRVNHLLAADTESARSRAIQQIRDYGQSTEYARELASAVMPGAKHRAGDWHGTLTAGQRARGIAVLGEIGGYESLVPLIEALGDSAYPVRTSASRAIQQVCRRFNMEDMRTRIAYRALVDALAVLPLSGRKVAADLVASAPADLVLEPLLLTGLRSTYWGARRESAMILGRLGDRRATRRLIETLQTDDVATVRAAAAWALGQLDAPVAIDPLVEASSDHDEIVRAACIGALAWHVIREWHISHPVEKAAQPIIGGLYDRDRSVRAAAVEALREINIPITRRALEHYEKRGRTPPHV